MNANSQILKVQLWDVVYNIPMYDQLTLIADHIGLTHSPAGHLADMLNADLQVIHAHYKIDTTKVRLRRAGINPIRYKRTDKQELFIKPNDEPFCLTLLYPIINAEFSIPSDNAGVMSVEITPGITRFKIKPQVIDFNNFEAGLNKSIITIMPQEFDIIGMIVDHYMGYLDIYKGIKAFEHAIIAAIKKQAGAANPDDNESANHYISVVKQRLDDLIAAHALVQL